MTPMIAILRSLAGRLRWPAMALVSTALAGTAGMQALERLDTAYPPPLDTPRTAVEIVDRDGALLRAFPGDDGTWRFEVALEDVDSAFVEMLIAYEDKRFRSHSGVDLVAVLRAAGQLVANGRIVSGGSTITMQVARLLEPRGERSLAAKLRQALRAVQIERRLSKDEILDLYLTLAPYGGNLEGIRAATLAWFGKEPKRLAVGEAALLVALPQLPERRRPDRNPLAAVAARDRVLDRLVTAGRLEAREAGRASSERVPDRRLAMPMLAAHASADALRADPTSTRHRLTISAPVQRGLEAVAREAAERLGPRLSVAMVMTDAQTGEILGHVGSASFLDRSRSGWIDMTKAVRSPGSTLKPFIYGLAFEQGMIAQETMIEDRPADFHGYRPRNFDMAYQGDVSIRTALQLSLNVPAVRLLDALGPARLSARFRQAGVSLQLPPHETPGLAVALGGAGITLTDLVRLYGGLAHGGESRALQLLAETPGGGATRVLSPQAAWQVTDILSGVVPPEGAPSRGIAYKTGTSYGYRDAWSVGYDGRHVLGVWVGRPDGGAVPGLSGYQSAAPVLFEAFARTGVAVTARQRPPAGALRLARDELPVTLRRFGQSRPGTDTAPGEPAPQIVYPPDGARVELAVGKAMATPLALKLQGGRAPFRWLADGRPLAGLSRRRTESWLPEGVGFATLTVIDAAGRSASVRVFVE
jgi:penicillin-binding protein 1C